MQGQALVQFCSSDYPAKCIEFGNNTQTELHGNKLKFSQSKFAIESNSSLSAPTKVSSMKSSKKVSSLKPRRLSVKQTSASVESSKSDQHINKDAPLPQVQPGDSKSLSNSDFKKFF